MQTGIEMTCSPAFACGANMVSVPIGAPPLDRKLCATIKEAQELKRTMELFANMREELKRERAIKLELLAALERLAGCYSDSRPPMPWADRSSQEISEAWVAVRAAIAKARGES